MKIALAQLSVSSNRDENLLRSIKMIQEAAQQKADLILFPEIFLERFFPQYPAGEKEDFALSINDPIIQLFQDACKKNNIFAVPNFYIKNNGSYYDMSLLIDNKGEIIGTQEMVHIAQFKNFYERDYYSASDNGFKVFDTSIGKIGIVVCFDRHYPESIRIETLRGADLILIPTANTTGEPEELFDWEIRVQAFQNSVNIAMCNRTGLEDQMTFNGRSIVVDHNGDILKQAGVEEELLIVDVDLESASKLRKEKQYHSLRRPELYD